MNTFDKMSNFFSSIQGDTVYLFGVTARTYIVAFFLKREMRKNVIFLDNDPRKQNHEPLFMSIQCLSPEKIKRGYPCVIMTEKADNRRHMAAQLRNMGSNDIRFINIDLIREYEHEMDDADYLKCFWYSRMGYELDLKNPKTYNEKIQWLKLYDRNPQYIMMADKYAVKDYVSDTIGAEYIIPTLGVWEHFDDIDFERLPEQFVLKCTHDSGSVIICKDKAIFEKSAAREKLENRLKINYFYPGREWVYKDIRPRIIAEKYMEDESGYELKDYKFFCFDGEPKLIQVDFDRFTNHHRNLYTTDWEYIDAVLLYPSNPGRNILRPERLDDMLMLSQKLSQCIPHVRIDFYNINRQIYFGEMTFYHEAGVGSFIPESFGIEVGKWLKLPKRRLSIQIL